MTLAYGSPVMTITSPATPTLEPSEITPDDWVAAYGDYLFNFAIGQVRDPGVAEDLVQETFLAAFKSRGRFTGQSSERTWLVGILRHKIWDQLRRACRERVVRVEPTPSREGEEGLDDAMGLAPRCGG